MNRRATAARRPPVVALLLFWLGACGDSPQGGGARSGGGERTAPKPAKTSWATDEMAADPEGYLQWADAQLEAQIGTRRERMASVAQRAGELEARRSTFGTNLKDVQNVQKRLGDALRKAEEEERFPVRMGGRSFEREKAKAILSEIERLLRERAPLQAVYDDGLARLAQITAALAGDVERLTALRDKLAVDLEQVRVSHGVAELGKLRATESEIAHYAKILGSMAEEGMGVLPNAPPPVDLDKLLE